MNIIIATLFTAIVMFFMFCCYSANAGPYIEAGLGVPLSPEKGYIPDQYGHFAIGWNHPIDDILSFDLSYQHKSLTGAEHPCGTSDTRCYGLNAIEGKFRLEW